MKKQMLAWLGASCFLAFGPSVFGQCTGRAVLNGFERSAFISAAYGERTELVVQLLARPGCSGVMLKSLQDLGATVRFADEKVGYALILLPKTRVLDVLDVLGVDYAQTPTKPWEYRYSPESAYVPPSDRKPAPVPPITLPLPRVAKELPQGGPYFAAAEAGLTALWKQHPLADGRGVRVAVIEAGDFDLLHPALKVAQEVNGGLVPKFADFIVFSDPDKSANWVQFGEPFQTAHGSFVAAGRSWTVPQDGTYRFGIFAKMFYLGRFRSDLEQQDPHLKSVSLSVGVLWDERRNRIWVDTDGDGSFANQRALGDYAETYDVDWFGRQDGEDDNRIPFGVKIDPIQHAAYLSMATTGGGQKRPNPHGALIAGSLAANRLSGGLFDGAAPNAQLIDVVMDLGLPAFLSAFARSDVDVVNRSGRIGTPTEDGTEDFERHVLERAIAVYPKPFAAVTGIPNSLNVMDYASPEMLRRNRQTSPPYVEYINGSVWFSMDGLVNTILAPSAQLGTDSRYLPGHDFLTKGELLPYAPAGYSIGANPSPTIPVVSGIVADLISGARRDHIRYDAVRLTQAVLIGARPRKDLPTALQGAGVANAAGAWEQLAKMAGGDDPANPILTSFTATRMEDGVPQPVNGFHADIPKAGGTLDGELWITRHGGYSGNRAYRLSLRGDEGVYRVVDEKILLLPNQPARVRFSAKLTPGLHVAFLQLRDAQAGVVMQEIPLSVRVPEVPERTAPWIEQYHQTIPPRRRQNLYVRLDGDTQAARYVVRIPYVGVQALLWLPNSQINNAAPSGDAVDKAHHVGPMQNIEVVSANTRAQTIEIQWSNRGAAEYEGPSDPPAPDVPISATLRVEKFAVAFGKADGNKVRVTNQQAQVNGRVEFYDATLRSSEVPGSGLHAITTLTRSLPAHLSQWRVAVSSVSVVKDPVDVFLLNCTAKEGCTVADQKPIAAKTVTLVMNDPQEGHWKIVIRARDAVMRPRTYQVREALLVPSTAATLSPTTANVDVKHASGETWSLPLPDKQGDAQYAAFIIAGKPFRILDDKGQELEKGHFIPIGQNQNTSNPSSSDMRVAMTPLSPNAP